MSHILSCLNATQQEELGYHTFWSREKDSLGETRGEKESSEKSGLLPKELVEGRRHGMRIRKKSFAPPL